MPPSARALFACGEPSPQAVRDTKEYGCREIGTGTRTHVLASPNLPARPWQAGAGATPLFGVFKIRLSREKWSPSRGGFPSHATIELLKKLSWVRMLRYEFRRILISLVRHRKTLIGPPNVVTLHHPHLPDGAMWVHQENLIGLNGTVFQQPSQMFGNVPIIVKREVDGLQDQNSYDVWSKVSTSRQFWALLPECPAQILDERGLWFIRRADENSKRSGLSRRDDSVA